MSDNKTRNQTLFEYLECLQTEFVNAELRKRIYPITKDKRYYTRTMKWKKTKIEDIAKRNELSTIFTSEKEKERIYKMTYQTWGLPNFLYRTPADIEEFRKWDVINYFAEGAEVKIDDGDGDPRIGTITDNSNIRSIFNTRVGKKIVDHNSHIVTVKAKGDAEVFVILIKHISRIL